MKNICSILLALVVSLNCLEKTSGKLHGRDAVDYLFTAAIKGDPNTNKSCVSGLKKVGKQNRKAITESKWFLSSPSLLSSSSYSAEEKRRILILLKDVVKEKIVECGGNREEIIYEALKTAEKIKKETEDDDELEELRTASVAFIDMSKKRGFKGKNNEEGKEELKNELEKEKEKNNNLIKEKEEVKRDFETKIKEEKEKLKKEEKEKEDLKKEILKLNKEIEVMKKNEEKEKLEKEKEKEEGKHDNENKKINIIIIHPDGSKSNYETDSNISVKDLKISLENDKILYENDYYFTFNEMFMNNNYILEDVGVINESKLKVNKRKKIRITLKTSIEEIVLSLSTDTIIKDIKDVIPKNENVNVNNLFVYYNEKECEDDKSLFELGIVDGSVLDIKEYKTITAYVKYFTSTFSICLPLITKISEFKETLAGVLSTDRDSLKLYYNEKELLDEKSVEDYDIVNDSIIEASLI